MPTLYTASFYDPKDWVGHLCRVSRGHPRGRNTQWETLSFLYLPRELLRDYRSGNLDFDSFAQKYLRGLHASYEEGGEFRMWLCGIATLGDFTLLCFERAGQWCHRRALAR